MARQFIPIEDVSAQGLAENMPPTGKLWKKLENVFRGASGWKRRPGTRRIGTGLPAGNSSAPVVLMTEYKHANSTSTSEITRPTSVGTYNTWTVTGAGNAALALDEVVASDTDYIETTPVNNKTSLVMGTLTNSFTAITSIRITLRIQRDATLQSTVQVSVRIGGTDYSLGTVSVDTGSGFAFVALDSTKNPATKLPWTSGVVSGLEIILEKSPGGAVTTEVATVTPTTNSWAIFGDGNLTTADEDTGGYQSNGQVVGATGSVTKQLQQAVAASVLAWGSDLKTYLIVQYRSGPAPGFKSLRMYNGSTAAAGFVRVLPRETYESIVMEVPWIGAGAGTVGVGTTSAAAGDQFVSKFSIERRGKIVDNTSPLRVSQLYMAVEGDAGAGAQKLSLIHVTSKGFFRVSEDLTTYTDIRGTAAVPTASEGTSWDQATFLNKLYLVNGKDQIFHYPTANAFAQFSGKPTGATVAAYNDRLVLGDVLEGGVREQARIRYSAYVDASNWTDTTSGNLELNETLGKIVKLKPLVEQSQSLTGVLVAYKTTGIYHLTPTAISTAPFAKKLMDGSAGCLARGSVVGVSDAGGRESHVFLGTVGGTVTVLSWNGAAVAQIGTPIAPLLRNLADGINLEKSFAVVDTFGNYILMFPTSGNTFLRTAVVYHFAQQLWTTWTLNNVTAMGRWKPSTGPPVTILGRVDGLAYYFDSTISTDDIEGQDAILISATLQTGDISVGPLEQETTLERVWMFYEEDTAPTVWDVDSTTDGGGNFTAGETSIVSAVTLDGGSDKRVLLSRADSRVTGRKHGVRFRSSRNDGNPELLQLILEVEGAGVLP